MKTYYFNGMDPQTVKPFSMVVSGLDYSAAKKACVEWLRTRQRDDIADLIEKSEKRAVRVLDPTTPCVLYSDVIWSVAPPEKVFNWLIGKRNLLRTVYLYGDDEINIESPEEVTIWPDSYALVEATKEITEWKSRNNGQFYQATNPAAMIEWLEKNAKLRDNNEQS